MLKSRKLLAQLLAILAVFALVAAACGDDDEAADDDTTVTDDDSADAPVAREAGRSVDETICTPDHGDETHDDRGNGVEQRQDDLIGDSGEPAVLPRTTHAQATCRSRWQKHPAGSYTLLNSREGQAWASGYRARWRS